MTTFDFSPLFRTSVGYDRLASLLNSAHRLEQGSGFPPYNIQKAGEDRYRITMAVAGFSESDLKITSEQTKLIVTTIQKLNTAITREKHEAALREIFGPDEPPKKDE